MVAFIAAQPVLTDVPEADVAEDPVCHMKVRVVESTPRAEGDGGTAFFCSAACRDAFVRRAR
jgi:YHS domain-containing protein